MTASDFKRSIVAGTVMASFTIEGFSLSGLDRASKSAVAARMKAFEKMLRIA